MKRSLVSLLLLLTILGCATTTTITKSEKDKLIKFAKGVIYRLPTNKLPMSYKHYVLEHNPKIFVAKSNDSKRVILLTWRLPNGNVIKYRAEGDISDLMGSFRGVSMYSTNIKGNINR